jgi:hypothetical protein
MKKEERLKDFNQWRLISIKPSPSTSFKLVVTDLAGERNHPIGLF